MLSHAIVLSVAHSLYAGEYFGELEERGLAPSQVKIEEFVPHLADETEHLPIIWRMIGRIEQAWLVSDLGLVFHHMGILDNSDDQEHALFDLCMGCMGHGISITDDFGDRIAHAAEVLNTGVPFEPIYAESFGDQWREIAMAEIDREYGPREDEE